MFSYILEIELSGSSIEKCYQKKVFLIFWEMETAQELFIIQEMELFNISGNFLYFRK